MDEVRRAPRPLAGGSELPDRDLVRPDASQPARLDHPRRVPGAALPGVSDRGPVRLKPRLAAQVPDLGGPRPARRDHAPGARLEGDVPEGSTVVKRGGL